MQEDIDMYMEMAEESMQGAIKHLHNELLKVRTGRASTAVFDNVVVDYYGSMTPVGQVASIKVPDARSIIIEPWEKNMLTPIERAIINSNLGMAPQNDGTIIRINIPPLTEERRKEFVKKVKAHVEDCKVSIRNARRDVMDSIKKAVKDGYPEDSGKDAEDSAQKLTNSYTNKSEKLGEAKEKDIMTV